MVKQVKQDSIFKTLYEKALVADRPEQVFEFYRDNIGKFPANGYQQFNTANGLVQGSTAYVVDRATRQWINGQDGKPQARVDYYDAQFAMFDVDKSKFAPGVADALGRLQTYLATTDAVTLNNPESAKTFAQAIISQYPQDRELSTSTKAELALYQQSEAVLAASRQEQAQRQTDFINAKIEARMIMRERGNSNLELTRLSQEMPDKNDVSLKVLYKSFRLQQPNGLERYGDFELASGDRKALIDSGSNLLAAAEKVQNLTQPHQSNDATITEFVEARKAAKTTLDTVADNSMNDPIRYAAAAESSYVPRRVSLMPQAHSEPHSPQPILASLPRNNVGANLPKAPDPRYERVLNKDEIVKLNTSLAKYFDGDRNAKNDGEASKEIASIFGIKDFAIKGEGFARTDRAVALSQVALSAVANGGKVTAEELQAVKNKLDAAGSLITSGDQGTAPTSLKNQIMANAKPERNAG